MNPLKFDYQSYIDHRLQPIDWKEYESFKILYDAGMIDVQSLCMELDIDRRTAILYMTTYNREKKKERCYESR